MTELLQRLDDLLPETEDTEHTLSSELREQLSALLGDASEADIATLAETIITRLETHPGDPRLVYAHALCEEISGRNEVAGNLYLQLAQGLATLGDWPGVVELAVQAMPLTGDYRLVRLVRKAGGEGVDIGAALETALEECSDSPDLLWEESQAADARKDSSRAVELALEAVNGYIVIKESEHIEDPLLRALECDEVEVTRQLLPIMRRLARAGFTELLYTVLELAEDRFFTQGLTGDLAETVVHILERREDLTDLRKLYAKAIAAPLGSDAHLQELIEESGLANPGVPIEDALPVFKEMAAYRPGAHVWHRSWGVGRVVANEGGELVVDFEEKPNHHMAADMAQKILAPLAEDCLQVRRHLDLEGLKQEAQKYPANILVQLMEEANGEIVTPDIKMRIVDWLITETNWSTWWKKARKAAEEDSRIDCSQAFRQVYRLSQGQEEVDVPLPNLDPRKGIKGAVSLINRLLQQHPDVGERAKMHYGSELRRWLNDSHKPGEWLRALPLLLQWYPERAEEWRTAIETHLPGASLTLAATPEDQEALLQLGLTGRSWKEAAFSAVASRFAHIKEMGLKVLRERCGTSFWIEIEEMLQMSSHGPEKMALADLIIQGQLQREGVAEGEPPLNPWLLLRAALSVVGAKHVSAGRGTANRLFKVGGQLAQWLKDRELTEEDLPLFDAFRRHPIEGEIQLAILAFLQAIGHEPLADEILRFRSLQAAHEDLPPELDPRVTLMTRKTFEEQTIRLREMERQLADDIPKEIAKARALGDLKENAEYHAARERQGIIKAMSDVLSQQMETAQVIEDLTNTTSGIGVGTLVQLRNVETGQEQQVWLLGEGDSQFGHEVVSYKAPLGQALVGRRIGDRITLEGDDAPTYEILLVEPKLP